MSESRSVLVRISGRVQGVGFRDWTQREAARRNLSGWVRNLVSGEVEALFTGASDDVTGMLEACRQGPRHARVDAIHASDADEAAAGAFTIRRDR